MTSLSSSSSSSPVTSSTLVNPRILYLPELTPACSPSLRKYNNPLECSVHTLPKQMLREFRHVFRDECQNGTFPNDQQEEEFVDDAVPRLLAIPTNQMAREDLVAVGEHIEAEKDRLLNVFIKFAEEICQKLKAHNNTNNNTNNTHDYWCDFIDPCSGLPMLSTNNHNKVYSEVDGMEVLLNYRTYQAGFCKILVHPQWQSAVYPATIFAYAPVALIKELMSEYRIVSSTE